MTWDFALTWDLALILLLLGVWVPWRGARWLRLLLAAGDITQRVCRQEELGGEGGPRASDA